jgi:hypothetical protein
MSICSFLELKLRIEPIRAKWAATAVIIMIGSSNFSVFMVGLALSVNLRAAEYFRAQIQASRFAVCCKSFQGAT